MKQRLTLKGYAVCIVEPEWIEPFGVETVDNDRSLLPGGLRRRSSLCTQIAITAGLTACQRADVDSQSLVSVFASVGGEIQVTDDLCRVLPDPEVLISPTRFHNSVHNTTAGYWSIMNKCRAPTTAIASVNDVFAIGVLETWSQLQGGQRDLLLVCYDERWPDYLASPVGKHSIASAFVLSTCEPLERQYSITLPEKRRRETELSGALESLIREVPAAACLPLIQKIESNQQSAAVPLGQESICWHTDLHRRLSDDPIL